ncbi:MAG: hypothetical protein ACYS6K_29585 [Planctomycetota bacterium]|jgi:PP-loop superfamily ATP-utilizing enzyme
MDFQDKYNSLVIILKKLDKVVVAYSGGVDSTFLLKAAVDTLGTENVLACIGISSSLGKSQYSIRQIIPTDVFTANPTSTRCCKTSLIKRDLEVLFAVVI